MGHEGSPSAVLLTCEPHISKNGTGVKQIPRRRSRKNRKSHSSGAASLKSSRGKARDSQWNEACFGVRRNDKGGSATQHMDFLRSRKEGNPETNARARVDPAAKINRLSFSCEI
jgi:hypothetical protein